MKIASKLLGGVALAGIYAVAGVPAAFAQVADAQELPATPSVDDDADSASIVVTGSRIRRTGADNPNPTTVVTSQTIEQSGVTEIADLVNQIPSAFVTQTNQTANLRGSAGMNTLNLRGLGADRTLVLVNGRRRVPSSPGSSVVDISALPSRLVERVEVVTGGASALYGADAVAGVANFILKKDFDGVEANARYGVSTRGDAGEVNLDLLYGKNFAGGRGNLTLFGSYLNSPDLVRGQDRPWTAGGLPLYRHLPDDTWQLTDGNRSIYDHNEAIVELGGRGNLYTFNPDGSLRRPQLGPGGILNLNDPWSNTDLSTYLTDGGEFLGRFDGYLLQVPRERVSGFGTFSYDLTDRVRFFTEGGYTHTSSRTRSQSFASYGYDYVPADSPFITPAMIAANGGPIASALPFTRRYTELGPQDTFYDRSTMQVTTGFDGTLPNILGKEWNWALSYSYGETRQKIWTRNATSADRVALALDSTVDAAGNAVCRSSLTDPANGCVALNPFLPLSQGAMDYIRYDTSRSTDVLRQHVVSGYATGELFSLPAGAVQAVLGGEYRKESNDLGVAPEFNPDSPLYDPTIGVVALPLVGKYDVKEAFGEVRIPLLKEVPFFHQLSVEGAVRFSDYSTAGSTTSWKVSGEWAPVRDLRFRSTYGQAVRAPNISELFTSSSISGAWLRDPCNYYDVEYRQTATEFTKANCAVLDPTRKNSDYYQWLDVNSRGNSELGVETAKTLTVGAVLRPRFLPHLTLSADYFDIRLRGAIDAFSAQTILEKCVDAPTLDNIFCELVERDSGNNPVSVIAQQLNLALYHTRGIDFEADYWFDLSSLGFGGNSGRISVNAAYTRLIKRENTLDPDDPNTRYEYAGVFGSPKWKGVIRTTYSNGPVTLNWNLRHFSSMQPFRTETPEKYDVLGTGDVFYNDFYAAVTVADRLTLYGGANNAFDRAPPRLPGAESGGANFEQGSSAGLYDTLGRTIYVGARLRY
ncbi:TonB-dependent receptor plug domain-containing protein [Sphingomonas sp. 3-13AW]|uniref:TonB-dependent receptor plug domain-containing protein n=1 Tax=Sphingomonas sp. 3-13AW TaxID=3050450 RepID=UPI003BB65BE9